MADSKISGLAAVASFLGAQEYAVNDAGTSRKITGTQLIAAVAQGTLSGGYAQVVANQAAITTAVDLAGLTATVTVAAGRRIEVSFQLVMASTVANDIASITIQEGATVLQTTYQSVVGSSNGNTMFGVVVLTPSAAAHTYKLTAVRAVGTGIFTMQANSTTPAFICVKDIGV